MAQTNDEWYQAGPREFYRYFDAYPDQERRESKSLEGMYWKQYRVLHRRWYSVKINIGKLYGRR